MKKLIFAFFLIILMSSSCVEEDGHETITFINNSNHRLYVMGDDIIYPDTSIVFGDLTKSADNIVDPKSIDTGVLRLYHTTYEHHLNHPTQDTLMVFIFDAKVLETTPWDTVKANYLVLKRYDLSLEDLERLNWTITYP